MNRDRRPPSSPQPLWLVALFAAFCFGAFDANAQSVTRGPYLQRAGSTSITIHWRTSTPTASAIRYGTDSGDLALSVSDANPVTQHALTLVGLLPATRYYYAITDEQGLVLAGGDPSTFFQTAPPPGTTAATRIWVIGDSGSHEPPPVAVRSAYEAFIGDVPPALWLMLGDNAYDDGTDLEYQTAVFDMFPLQLRQTPVWSALGNHDGRSADSATQTGPYYEIFDFPRFGELGGVASGTEAYYSFDHANAHFVVLDSYESDPIPAGGMRTWLEADLADMTARATTDWLIALWHHPPYSKGGHDSDYATGSIAMREVFVPLLEAHGADLILAGHSHSYERSRLIDGHYGTSGTFAPSHLFDGGDGRPGGAGAYTKPTLGHGPREGAVYAVVGSSSKLSNGSFDHPAMHFSLRERGSLVIDLNGAELQAYFIEDTGLVRDSFVIQKGAAPATSSIAGRVWHDEDHDGVRDVEEDLLAAIEVALTQGNGVPIATTTTDAQGEYGFVGLNAGHYRVGFSPGARIFTHPRQGEDPALDSDASTAAGFATLTLGETEARTGVDAGLLDAFPVDSAPIDLSETNATSYALLDAPPGGVAFGPDGMSIHATGTRWLETLSTHDVVAESVLSFEFRSTNPGSPMAIGFDEDGDPTTGIRLLGLTSDGDPETRPIPQTYQGGWQTYRIPIGRHFTGDALRLVLGVTTPAPAPGQPTPPPAEIEIRDVRLPEPGIGLGAGIAALVLIVSGRAPTRCDESGPRRP
jgi:acid phosphatase type 7